jgi:CarD family transcriptional regulator
MVPAPSAPRPATRPAAHLDMPHAPVLSAPPAAPVHAAPVRAAPVRAAAPVAAAPAAAPAPAPSPAPLPAPKPEPIEFAEGDHVVYPTHGVGKVMGIVNEEIAGHKLQLIVVTFDENRMTLRVPVAKARSSGLRKLASRKLLDTALNTLKGRARIKRTMWSRRAQEYEAKINSGDPVAIAEVVRDLHRNAGQPDQSFSERQIYEAALDRLASELAAIESIDKPAATEKLAGWLKAA